MRNQPVFRSALMGCLASLVAIVPSPDAEAQTATPAELVATYDSLADTLLGALHTERNLVQSILTTTYAEAETTLGEAKAKIQAGQSARAEVERLAALVAQLGNEGDAAVAAVRKRLIEGGHHHNAAGEQQGIYDEGFVIVTRAAKKVFLDSAAEIGKLSSSPDPASLDAQWKKVQTQFRELMASKKR